MGGQLTDLLSVHSLPCLTCLMKRTLSTGKFTSLSREFPSRFNVCDISAKPSAEGETEEHTLSVIRSYVRCLDAAS